MRRRKLKEELKANDIYGNSKSKSSLIKCLQQEIEYISKLPDEAKISNQGDDYIFFTVDPKDKDDRKFYKSLGFRRESE